jgi:hypothetical protein
MRVALNIRAIFGSEVEGLCDGIVAVETAPIQIAISSRFKKSILFHGEFFGFLTTQNTRRTMEQYFYDTGTNPSLQEPIEPFMSGMVRFARPLAR